MKFVKTSDGNIGAFVDGKTYCVTPDSMHYDAIYNALKEQDTDQFKSLYMGEQTLEAFCEGHIDFKFGSPRWQGVPMPDLFADRIIELVKGGHEFEPMLNFMYNLAENPDDHSIVELIDFLGNKNLPITKDGYFLGYKAVTNDYLDKYSGKFKNTVGSIHGVERREVDADRTNECSNGLHVGALEYVSRSYGNVDINNYDPDNKGGDRIVIVKVNPKDVVTVPRDYQFQKLRACRYEVVAEFTGALEDAVYDDAIMFKNTVPDVIVERKSGWVSKMKDRFARITQLIRNGTKDEYVEV